MGKRSRAKRGRRPEGGKRPDPGPRQLPPRIALCIRIGRLPIPPPPGYETTDCEVCGAAVWIAPETVRVASALRAKPVCSDCTGHTGEGKPWPLGPGPK
jgi:hypothetical protein